MEDPQYVVVTNTENWRGTLGLLHPTLLDYFSHLEQNIQKHGLKCRQTGPELVLEIPLPNEDIIPVLIYVDGLLWGKREGGYLLITLKEGEFEEIEGANLAGILAQVERVCIANSITMLPGPLIEKQWDYLGFFNPSNIHEIPLDIRAIRGEETELILKGYDPKRGDLIFDF